MAHNMVTEKIRSLFWPTLLLVATALVLGPIYLYLTNAQELWFGLEVVIGVGLVCGLAGWLFLTLIGLLLPKKLSYFYSLFLFGLGLAFYVQGHFLQPHYGLLDGQSIDWSQYHNLGIVNTVVWLLCLQLPFWLARFRSTPRIIKVFSLIIIGTQALSLAYGLVNGQWRQESRYYLSEKDIFTISEEKNIIVFVLDTLDAHFMDKTLKAYPEVVEAFKDFTYYNNVVGAYTNTIPAIPHILTGQLYKNETPLPEYIQEAYKKSPLLEMLRADGYRIGLYEPFNYLVPPKASYIDNRVDGVPGISDYPGFAFRLYQFVSLKYLPHYLKKYVWLYTDEFEKFKGGDWRTPAPFKFDDVGFYSLLKKQGITVNGSAPAFKFYHLLGAHPPYVMNENVEIVSDGSASCITQSRGALKIVEQYIQNLKGQGAYDDTLIVVMADHGLSVSSFFPMVMIKEPQARKPFEISSAPLSYEDFLPTIITLAGGGDIDGTTFQDWSEGQSRDRNFLYYIAENRSAESYLPPMIEYLIKGSPNDMYYEIKSGRFYTDKGPVDHVQPTYALGTVLSFIKTDKRTKASDFLFEGLSNGEATHTWSLGRRSRMNFSLDRKPKGNLAVTFKFHAVYNARGPQRLLFSANGHFVEEATVSSDQLGHTFIVPSDLIADQTLSLQLEYPDAVEPVCVSNSCDPRILAVAFESLVIDETAEVLSARNKAEVQLYSLGTVLSFVDNAEPARYFNSGLAQPEKTHTWSLGHASEMEMRLDRQPQQDLVGELKLHMYHETGRQGQEVIISSRGRELDRVRIAGDLNLRFVIPKELIADRELSLRFDYPEAASPSSLGRGADPRVLAVAFESLVIDETETDEASPGDSGREPQPYQLGTVLSFVDSAEPGRYFNSGLAQPEKTHTWSLGRASEIEMRLDRQPQQDLLGEIKLHMYHETGSQGQEVIISSRGRELSRVRIAEDLDLRFVIPKELIADRELSLRFDYPEAASPSSLGRGADPRILAVAFETMTIDER